MIVHRYAGAEANNPNQWANNEKNWIKQANGKLVYVEEWGVNTDSYDASKEYPANMQDMIKAGLPQLYWQILPKVRVSKGYRGGIVMVARANTL